MYACMQRRGSLNLGSRERERELDCNRKRRVGHCAPESHEELRALTWRAHVRSLQRNFIGSARLRAEQVKRVRIGRPCSIQSIIVSRLRVFAYAQMHSQHGRLVVVMVVAKPTGITITRLSEQLSVSQWRALENTQRNQLDDLLSADHQHHKQPLVYFLVSNSG